MTFEDLTGVVIAMASTLGALLHTPAVVQYPRTRSQEWMADRHEYELLVDGGVRGMLERSPMRYDVALYCGVAS